MRSAPTTTSSGSSPGSESSTRSSSGSNAAGQGSSQMPPDTHTSFVPRIPMAVLVRDVPGFAALGYADVPMMVLGMDLLGQGRLVLQLASQRVFVQEPAEFDPEGQDNS